MISKQSFAAQAGSLCAFPDEIQCEQQDDAVGRLATRQVMPDRPLPTYFSWPLLIAWITLRDVQAVAAIPPNVNRATLISAIERRREIDDGDDVGKDDQSQLRERVRRRDEAQRKIVEAEEDAFNHLQSGRMVGYASRLDDPARSALSPESWALRRISWGAPAVIVTDDSEASQLALFASLCFRSDDVMNIWPGSVMTEPMSDAEQAKSIEHTERSEPLEVWFVRYVREHDAKGERPDRRQNWLDARAAGYRTAKHENIRDLRDKHANHWTKGGRPKKAERKPGPK